MYTYIILVTTCVVVMLFSTHVNIWQTLYSLAHMYSILQNLRLDGDNSEDIGRMYIASIDEIDYLNLGLSLPT
jgi:hypothetical protein